MKIYGVYIYRDSHPLSFSLILRGVIYLAKYWILLPSTTQLNATISNVIIIALLSRSVKLHRIDLIRPLAPIVLPLFPLATLSDIRLLSLTTTSIAYSVPQAIILLLCIFTDIQARMYTHHKCHHFQIPGVISLTSTV